MDRNILPMMSRPKPLRAHGNPTSCGLSDSNDCGLSISPPVLYVPHCEGGDDDTGDGSSGDGSGDDGGADISEGGWVA